MMTKDEKQNATESLEAIIASARRLGVEIDEAEALQWMSAMAARGGDEDIVVDTRSGIFGHSVTMLDFNDEDLEHFRRIGRLVEFNEEPGVETALALSGSAAQSKIQSYPGDCDFFERINIHADSREAAGRTLARLIREKALATAQGPTYQLTEVRFGSYPQDVVRDGQTFHRGSSIAWSVDEIEAGCLNVHSLDGEPLTIGWEEVAQDPGWCKLDWLIADALRGQLANASNMLDATWEAPDGTITPLDGYLDPYFQEIYLDAGSVPIFSRLARHVSANALDEYVAQLEKEVAKYLSKDINYGKAAKRMYNIFRFTGRYQEAAFLRELFDEPSTVLYQIWSLIRTLDEALQPNGSIPLSRVYSQADQLVMSVIQALEGEEEAEIVRLLLRLRNTMTSEQRQQETWEAEVTAVRAQIINMVNNFFYEKLSGLPTIKSYIAQFEGAS